MSHSLPISPTQFFVAIQTPLLIVQTAICATDTNFSFLGIRESCDLIQSRLLAEGQDSVLVAQE
jgi:hypothetical protein